MGLMNVLAVLVMAGICVADELVMVENTTYAHVMLNGMTNISKQADMEKDKNKIVFAPMNVMTTNDSSTFTDIDISMMNFTLTASASATEGVNSNRVVGVMTSVTGGTLTMHVDVFTAMGNVSIDGEVTMVKIGDMRVTLLLSGLTWPAGSTLLKVKFMIAGKDAPTMDDDEDSTDGTPYELGGDGMVILSKKSKEGSTFSATAPTVSSNMVTVQFAKGGGGAYMYQFFIKPADVDVKKDTSASVRVTSLGALALVVTALVAMLW